uniref:Odorant-binding protein n=1 Tax=Galeruca daurica TaxID=1651263 RepID=A0A1U9W4Z6_9CUCU|nr:odorant-binding protein [Galeruca daurica]
MVKFVVYIVVAVLIACVCCTTLEYKPAKMAECLSEVGVTEDDIKEIPSNDKNKIACFWKCIMEKTGVVSADGVVHPDKVEIAFPEVAPKLPAAVLNEFKTCLGTVGNINSCEDVQKIRSCLKND